MPDPTHTRRRITGALLGLACGALAVLLISTIISTRTLVGEVRGTQQKNSPVLRAAKNAAESAEESTRLLKDCTIEGGECYARGQRNTAGAVGDLGRLTVLAAACAASLETQELDVPARADRIQRCIERQLTREP